MTHFRRELLTSMEMDRAHEGWLNKHGKRTPQVCLYQWDSIRPKRHKTRSFFKTMITQQPWWSLRIQTPSLDIQKLGQRDERLALHRLRITREWRTRLWSGSTDKWMSVGRSCWLLKMWQSWPKRGSDATLGSTSRAFWSNSASLRSFSGTRSLQSTL